MTRAGEAWSRAAALTLMAAACSRPDAAPREVISTSPRVLPGLGVPPPAPPADSAPAPAVDLTPHHDPLDFDAAPLSYTVTERLEAAAGPVADPDRAIVEAARVSAGTCFAGLENGPDVQSAVLEVTVVPSGRVSRTNVSAQTSVREVVDCLTRVGDGLHFSSREEISGANSQAGGIRSFSIDVTVARPH